MPMTEPRFRTLCSYWTKIPETPRCVALNLNYEPTYSMWSKCEIAIPLMNGESFALFSPGTFSKTQLDKLNLHRTGRPDSDLAIARFMRCYNKSTSNQQMAIAATFRDYLKSQNSTDNRFSGFPPIPLQRPEQYGYSRPLLNALMTIIAPKPRDIVAFGTFNPDNSLHTILYVSNRTTRNTFWIMDKPSAPRKDRTK